ncbi:hypothetical protein ACIA8F_19425 [Streptomyces sp. NPDC051563]|uniref:hypothetical protein n=1 Tax=Streptomyces sp. NPDC051563 TaxID=3365659 RepID=UPI0037AA7D8E
MAVGNRRRRSAVAVVTVGAIFAFGAGLYGLNASGSWPFPSRYCWGAWEEDSGPSFLGEEALAKSGSERRSEESPPPSPVRANATCTLAVASSVADADSTHPLTFDERVVLEYRPVPAGAEERRAWMAHFFDGSASPLPDGLNGLVADDRAMLVLPDSCDADGRPSVVTIRSESWGDGHLGKKAMPFSIGSRMDVARMLVAAAEATMTKAGCTPGKPLRLTSPLAVTAEKDEPAAGTLCRIPGLTFEFGKGSAYQQQVGAVGQRLQTCSVVWRARGVPDEPAAQFVMAAEPRIVALFDGLPEGVGEGLVRATCDGRPTVFYGNVEPGLKVLRRPDDRQMFVKFVESVSKRIGCKVGEAT